MYKHGDKIRFVRGFYEGMEGVLTSYSRVAVIRTPEGVEGLGWVMQDQYGMQCRKGHDTIYMYTNNAEDFTLITK